MHMDEIINSFGYLSNLAPSNLHSEEFSQNGIIEIAHNAFYNYFLSSRVVLWSESSSQSVHSCSKWNNRGLSTYRSSTRNEISNLLNSEVTPILSCPCRAPELKWINIAYLDVTN